jgi:hypothetical protein
MNTVSSVGGVSRCPSRLVGPPAMPIRSVPPNLGDADAVRAAPVDGVAAATGDGLGPTLAALTRTGDDGGLLDGAEACGTEVGVGGAALHAASSATVPADNTIRKASRRPTREDVIVRRARGEPVQIARHNAERDSAVLLCCARHHCVPHQSTVRRSAGHRASRAGQPLPDLGGHMTGVAEAQAATSGTLTAENSQRKATWGLTALRRPHSPNPYSPSAFQRA